MDGAWLSNQALEQQGIYNNLAGEANEADQWKQTIGRQSPNVRDHPGQPQVQHPGQQ